MFANLCLLYSLKEHQRVCYLRHSWNREILYSEWLFRNTGYSLRFPKFGVGSQICQVNTKIAKIRVLFISNLKN